MIHKDSELLSLSLSYGEYQAEKLDAVEIDTYEGGDLVFYNLLKNEKAARVGLSLSGQPSLLVAFDSRGP